MNTVLKRTLTVAAALLILFYIGYQIFVVLYSPVQTAVIAERSVYETVSANGIAVRNETQVARTAEGYAYYTVDNGTRVSNGGNIALMFANESDAWAQEEKLLLDEEISELENVQIQGTANRVNLSTINTQLKKKQIEIIDTVGNGSFSGVDDLAGDMLQLINKKQITIGRVTDFSGQINALKAERAQLDANYGGVTSIVTSPCAGYFVNRVDGYETVLNYGNVTSMTTGDVRAAIENKPAVDEHAYIGKVVGDYEWYLSCVLTSEQAGLLSIDDTMNVRLPFVSNEVIPVTVVALNRDSENNVAAVFKSDYMSGALSSARVEQIQVLVKKHDGLFVPDEAIYFNDNQEAGVYVRVGNMIVFRRIEIEYHNEAEKYTICRNNGQDGYIRLYDDVVVSGKGLYDGKIIG